MLQQQLPEARIGLVHGRFKCEEKKCTMQAFSAHQTDILVATTVVEVGIDVPNASLIIIDNAERLGLAQLHQLRGRVGRGAQQSFCVLLYQSPLSQHARERLDILKTSQDGFWIAEKDFQLRGSGEWLGTKQTGVASYKIARLETDGHYLETSRQMIAQCPTLATGEALVERWLGRKTQYQEV
jgi:ATP-dependent DNA helicase RecG